MKSGSTQTKLQKSVHSQKSNETQHLKVKFGSTQTESQKSAHSQKSNETQHLKVKCGSTQTETQKSVHSQKTIETQTSNLLSCSDQSSQTESKKLKETPCLAVTECSSPNLDHSKLPLNFEKQEKISVGESKPNLETKLESCLPCVSETYNDAPPQVQSIGPPPPFDVKAPSIIKHLCDGILRFCFSIPLYKNPEFQHLALKYLQHIMVCLRNKLDQKCLKCNTFVYLSDALCSFIREIVLPAPS